MQRFASAFEDRHRLERARGASVAAQGGQINIVIPHVDGSAAGYRERCETWGVPWVPCHVRDLGELRYVLRSIEVHAQWAGPVILVVQDEAHVPAWLDPSSVRVVTHDAFMPPDVLPTFHWTTIAAHLHRIPFLSERFVIWEDDVILGRPLAEADLFDANGPTHRFTFPIIPGAERFAGTYQQNLTHSRTLLRRVLPGASCFLYPHVPLPSTRAAWAELSGRLASEPLWRDTITRRHRGDERVHPTIDPAVVYANWYDVARRRRPAMVRWASMAASMARLNGTYPVVNDPRRMRRHMERLARCGRTFMNVNDEAWDDWDGPSDLVNPQSLRLLDGALSSLFPKASRFERPA